MDERTSRAVRASGHASAVWLSAIAWAGLTFAFSAQPNLLFVPDAGLDLVVSKLGHRRSSGSWPAALAGRRRHDGGCVARGPRRALAVPYAISDELHHGFGA